MKKSLLAAQVVLLFLFSITFLSAGLLVFGVNNPLAKFNYNDPVYNQKEEFDPLLSRLNSIDILEDYCDSLYAVATTGTTSDNLEETYTDIVSGVIRKRFYHGYSRYGFHNNFVAFLTSRVTLKGYSAIVIPDEIMEYPFAACSQQAIIMMEVLQKKGFKTRKISFNGKIEGGHFSFEVFFKGSWHFYDPNMEPDMKVLKNYNRPGVAFLVNNPDILLQAYHNHPAAQIMDIFPTYSYGEVNKFPAPRGIVFQKASRVLSYTIWLFFLLGYFIVRRQYTRITRNSYVRNRRIYFPQPQTGTSPSYYPGFTAPGT